MAKQYAYINGKLVPYKEATIHVSDLSIQRGFSAFEFMRTQNGKPFLLNDHLNRLINSADGMGLEIPYPIDELTKQVNTLIRKNGFNETAVKIFLTGGYSPDGYSVAEPNLIIVAGDRATALRPEKDGTALVTYEHYRELPHVKSTNYMISVRLIPYMKSRMAADVLYTYQGLALECSRASFLIIKDHTIITADNNTLEGITRKKLLEIAAPEFNIEIRDIKLDEIYDAEEIFITSTTKKITPVLTIDNRNIGDGHVGPVTRFLQDLFTEFENNY